MDLLSNNKPLDAIKVLEATTIRGKRIAVKPKPETLSLYFDALSHSGLDNQTIRDKAVAAHAMGATSFLIQAYIQNIPGGLSNNDNNNTADTTQQPSSNNNNNVDFYPQHKDASSSKSNSNGGGGDGTGRYSRDQVRLHSSREKHLNTLDAITEDILGQTTSSSPSTPTREHHHHVSQTVDVVVGKIIQGSGSPHIAGTRLDGEVLLEKIQALVGAVEAAIITMKKTTTTTTTANSDNDIPSKSIIKGIHAAGGLLVQGIESKLYMALLDPGGLMFRRATDLLLRIEKIDNYLTLGSYKVLIRALLKQKRFKEVLPILGRYTTTGTCTTAGAAPKRHPSPPESLVQTCQDLAILGMNVLDEFYYDIEDYIGDGNDGGEASSATAKRAALSDEEKQGLVTALNIIITACGFGGDAQRAKETLESIKKLDLAPTRQSYDAAAFSYMFSNNVNKAWEVLVEAEKDMKLPKSHGTYCIEVELLGIEGKLEEAVDMLLLGGVDGVVFEEGEDFERTIRRCERAGEEGLLDRLLRRRYPNYKMEEKEYESIVSVQTRWRGVPGWRGLLYGSEGTVVRVKLMKDKAGGE